MQFMLLIYDEPERRGELRPEDWKALAAADAEFRQGIPASGARLLGNQVLEPPHDAISVHFDDGAATRKDGPATDGGQWLVGCYLLDCESADAAAKIAAGVPTPGGCGQVEVRPVLRSSVSAMDGEDR